MAQKRCSSDMYGEDGFDSNVCLRPAKAFAGSADTFKPIARTTSIKIAPVIVSAVDTPQYFLHLNFPDTKIFVDALAELVTPVKNVEVVSGGDLLVFPFDRVQKEAILKLKTINNVKVACNLTKSETEFKRVIAGVLVSEESDAMLDLLKDQHVTHVHRMGKIVDGEQNPSTVLYLPFQNQFRTVLSWAFEALWFEPTFLNRCNV